MGDHSLPLSQAYKDYFPIGTAVCSRTVVAHDDLPAEHFSSLTAGNEMKLAELPRVLSGIEMTLGLMGYDLLYFSERHSDSTSVN